MNNLTEILLFGLDQLFSIPALYGHICQSDHHHGDRDSGNPVAGRIGY